MKNHRLFFYLLLALCMIIPACENPPSEREPDLGFAEVDNIFIEWDRSDSPGCALGVIENGELIYAKGYGMANLDYGIPMTPQSVVYIASTSKQFTAACIALLIQRGKLSYEDDIRKYFPGIPDYGSPIKVKNLIHHTSGIRDYLGLMELAGLSYQDYFDNNTAVEWISRQKSLNFSPGEKFVYSNSGYVLLAELVKRVSGKTLREFARAHIFTPLKMADTHFNDDRSLVVKNRVVSYRLMKEEDDEKTATGPGSGMSKETENTARVYKRFLKNFDAVGDGNLLTTVKDLYRWDQNFYHDRVGEDPFIDLMLTRGKLNNGKELDYAFGLFHGEYKGLKTESHGGGMLGFRTEMLRFPEQKFTVICLGNSANFNPNQKCKKVADIFLAGQFKEETEAVKKQDHPVAVAVDKDILDSYTGKFRMNTGPVITVTREGGRLFAKLSGQSEMRLRALTETDFLNEETGARISFQKERESKEIQIDIRIGEMKLTAERIQIRTPTRAQLQEYAAEYYSEELEAVYALFLDEDSLMVRVKKNPPVLLEMSEKDTFASSQYELVFNRNQKDQIAGFTMDAGRVQNLKFVRK